MCLYAFQGIIGMVCQCGRSWLLQVAEKHLAHRDAELQEAGHGGTDRGNPLHGIQSVMISIETTIL